MAMLKCAKIVIHIHNMLKIPPELEIHHTNIVQLLMSSRGFSLLIRNVIYQNVHLDE